MDMPKTINEAAIFINRFGGKAVGNSWENPDF
jgi:hypothetical protein